MGSDPATGKTPVDGEQQVVFAFANLQKFLDAADVTADDVVRVTVLLGDSSLRSKINEEWEKMFPDPESRPARHAMNVTLNGAMLIQLEVVAVAAS
jgi:enamine deaminase RidA (YjgF/YER057c/UK114 family)